MLIEPTLFFIQHSFDDKDANNEPICKKSGYKIKKIKENHLILMLNLAKKCLADGFYGLVESALNIQISINLINDEFIPSPELRVKTWNQEFVQRYLNHMSDIIKTHIDSYNEEGIDFSC